MTDQKFDEKTEQILNAFSALGLERSRFLALVAYDPPFESDQIELLRFAWKKMKAGESAEKALELLIAGPEDPDPLF